jgi:hypothetical protein
MLNRIKRKSTEKVRKWKLSEGYEFRGANRV